MEDLEDMGIVRALWGSFFPHVFVPSRGLWILRGWQKESGSAREGFRKGCFDKLAARDYQGILGSSYAYNAMHDLLTNPMDLEVGLDTTPRSPEPGTQTLNQKSKGTPIRNPGNSCQNGGPYNLGGPPTL